MADDDGSGFRTRLTAPRAPTCAHLAATGPNTGIYERRAWRPASSLFIVDALLIGALHSSPRSEPGTMIT